MIRPLVRIAPPLALALTLAIHAGQRNGLTPNVVAGGFGNPAIAIPEAGAVGPIRELRVFNEWYRAVLIDQAAIADPLQLEAIARQYCEGLAPCRVGLWYSETEMPNQLPVQGQQLSHQVFAFGRTQDGRENLLWNCVLFPEFEARRECLPQPSAVERD